VGGAVTMIFVRIVEAIFGTKKQAAAAKNDGHNGQDCFDIHKFTEKILASIMPKPQRNNNFA
jgi:hypothetical protein